MKDIQPIRGTIPEDRRRWHLPRVLGAGLALLLPATCGWGDPADAPAAQVVTPGFIAQLSETLRTNHPALRAADARTAAAQAAAKSVRTWEDPMFRIGGMFADAGMRADEGDLIYGIEQKLPLFGRAGLAQKVAEADLSRARSDADYRFQTQRRDLAQQLFRTALAERTIEVSAEDLRWLHRVVEATQRRYEASASLLPDLLRLQSEERRQQERLETSRQELDHARLALNRMLNRDLRSPWPSLRLPEPAEPLVFSDGLVDLARRYEPRLKALREEVRTADAASRLTRRQRLPEVTLGAQGRNFTGNGEFRQAEVMLGFSLPWGNRRHYRQDYERDRARLAAAEEEAADYALGLAEEVHGLTVRIDTARREALAYREAILPRSRQALEAAESAWTVGRGQFLDVLEARRMLLESQLMFARAVAEQYEMLSDLVLCCGLGDLEALQMLGVTPATSHP